jgi:hypothetical protein
MVKPFEKLVINQIKASYWLGLFRDWEKENTNSRVSQVHDDKMWIASIVVLIFKSIFVETNEADKHVLNESYFDIRFLEVVRELLSDVIF